MIGHRPIDCCIIRAYEIVNPMIKPIMLNKILMNTESLKNRTAKAVVPMLRSSIMAEGT